jgi:hypothetical protein
MRFIGPLFIAAFALAAAADAPLHVVPVSGTPAPFRCGDRCKFRADVPAGPLRLRIFRGTVNELAGTGHDPRYVGATGCVEYFSTIIRTRTPRRPQNMLDLRFYFRPKWLSGNRDGHFVFVVEHDDNPNGPEVEERPPMLRLPSGLVAKYFRSGVDIVIRAPLYATAAPATRAAMGRETAAMTLDDDSSIETTVRTIPRVVAPTAAANDCTNVQFDEGQPVVIRRAEDRGDRVMPSVARHLGGRSDKIAQNRATRAPGPSLTLGMTPATTP